MKINKVKTFAAGLVTGAGILASLAYDDYFEISKNLEIHAILYREINTYYVDQVNPGELMQTGIDAMLSSLDPYTTYYPESMVEDARFESTGVYGGIGASFRNIDSKITIAETYENAPAQKAGIIPGDVITEVNGKNISGKPADEVLRLIKGAPGTKVQIKVKRDTDINIKSFDLVREEIKVKNVPYSGMISQDVGYIKLAGFTNDAGKDVKDALLALKEKNKLKGLVLDLRGNPGGLLREAVNVSNVFIDKGKPVVSTKGKVEEWNKTFKTLNPAADTEIPLVVLVDQGSASASEIVSGTIQDYDRGVVIGNKTYGKGLVQTTRPLKYNAQLKVTTSKYYIPSGRCIQAIDYGKKDANGKVIKIADSLQKEFRTLAGRRVYDGGGVMPDIPVADNTFHHISKALIRKNLVFIFANQYKSTHESIGSLNDFMISEADYQKFIQFLEARNFDYETQTDITLQELKKNLSKDNFMKNSEEELNRLQNKIKAEKKSDIQSHKEEIKLLLSSEIVSRYYFRKGRIEWALKHDDDITEALKVLAEPTRYKQILSSSFQIPRTERNTGDPDMTIHTEFEDLED